MREQGREFKAQIVSMMMGINSPIHTQCMRQLSYQYYMYKDPTPFNSLVHLDTHMVSLRHDCACELTRDAFSVHIALITDYTSINTAHHMQAWQEQKIYRKGLGKR